MQEMYMLVKGRVQGVSFRAFVRDHAVDLNIKGWVRNSGNDVEILAQGEAEDLNKLLEIVKQGPPPARVDNVKISRRDITSTYDDFKIVF